MRGRRVVPARPGSSSNYTPADSPGHARRAALERASGHECGPVPCESGAVPELTSAPIRRRRAWLREAAWPCRERRSRRTLERLQCLPEPSPGPPPRLECLRLSVGNSGSNQRKRLTSALGGRKSSRAPEHPAALLYAQEPARKRFDPPIATALANVRQTGHRTGGSTSVTLGFDGLSRRVPLGPGTGAGTPRADLGYFLFAIPARFNLPAAGVELASVEGHGQNLSLAEL